MSFKKFVSVTVALAHLGSVIFSSAAFANEFIVFEKTYVRGTGTPAPEIDNFSVLNVDTGWTVRAVNGGLEDGEGEKVSGSRLFLNNEEILQASAFNQTVTTVEEPVTLLNDNEISVELKGKPGSLIFFTTVTTPMCAPSSRPVSPLTPRQGFRKPSPAG